MRKNAALAEAGKGTVLFVDDAIALQEEFPKMLEREGHRILSARFPDKALEIIDAEPRIDLAILDMQLPMKGCKRLGAQETAGGNRAGLALARELRRRFHRVPVIFWTGLYDREVRMKVVELGNARLVPKAAGPDPILDLAADYLAGMGAGSRPRTFIVHGHDQKTMLEFKNYLQNTLRFPEPVVLREEPNYGRTIIEKLESFAYAVDVVFVLLTPDDRMAGPGADAGEIFRSRQNVIFELGYFLGVFGRTSGRVILLYRRPVDLPSDIGGMVSLDITDGIPAAAPEIEQELREWL